MSTVSTSQASPPTPDDADRFRFGWRDMIVRRPDGTEDLEQVPLTEEDALHPEFGDYIVHSDAHADDLTYLKYVFKFLLANNPGAIVLSDCGVDFELPGVKHICPDIAVFFEVDMEEKRLTDMFYVKAAHARSALVIEVTSRSTRRNDFDKKVDYYHRCGVPMYVIADARVEKLGVRKLELIGFRHTPTGYETVSPNANGCIWLEAMGVWLGVARDENTGFDRVACFDPVSNNELGDYTTIRRAYALEVEAHTRSENRAAHAEAEAAQALAEAAQARSEAAQARSEAAQAQSLVMAEAEARALAETRIRELEALLERSASDPT
jgi:colicin import membrane protein